jgi:hypothetical protein
MLEAAKLGALAEVRFWFVCREPELVRASGDEVHLVAEPGHPERVDASFVVSRSVIEVSTGM